MNHIAMMKYSSRNTRHSRDMVNLANGGDQKRKGLRKVFHFTPKVEARRPRLLYLVESLRINSGDRTVDKLTRAVVLSNLIESKNRVPLGVNMLSNNRERH